jgi:hypothetical protein
MRIKVQRSGGFANIGAHGEVDTSALPKEKADEVQRLVTNAALPPSPPPPLRAARAADVYQFDITVDDGSGAKTYRADELSMPDEWRSLVDYVLQTSPLGG